MLLNDKSDIRNHFLGLRRGLPVDIRREASQRIRAHLVRWLRNLWLAQSPECDVSVSQSKRSFCPSESDQDMALGAAAPTTGGKFVALYAATRGEVDVLPLISDLSGSGWRTAAPRTDVSAKALSFFEVNPATQWTKGAYGILEPDVVNAGDNANAVNNANAVLPEYLSVVLVPGVAFSYDGGRIGYGGGYYDRFLSRISPAMLVGVAFDVQVTDRLIVESHDVRMTHLVTESGIIPCREKELK